MKRLKIRRALLSVWDKSGLLELARALHESGSELVATGGTGELLSKNGLPFTPIEKVTGMPEAFDGRMKTLSFEICSGILYRRGNTQDEADMRKLGLGPIDAVVVNFYPFAEKGTTEAIDIGGPTLVRAAAKNAPDVLALTAATDYASVIAELRSSGTVAPEVVERSARLAWERILDYDAVIARKRGERGRLALKYGENPHQSAFFEYEPLGPIDYAGATGELSYNNLLDLAAAYGLASDLAQLEPTSAQCVIVKHGSPCGVGCAPSTLRQSLRAALATAWEGDPISAFGGVIVFSQPIGDDWVDDLSAWFKERFVEVIAAPGLEGDSPTARALSKARKNIKLVPIRRFGESPQEMIAALPGGRVFQSADGVTGGGEVIKSVTRRAFPTDKNALAQFGIVVCKHLKSNAIAIVREVPGSGGVLQLAGAGQGQPNRVDAVRGLAIPRAQDTLKRTGGKLSDCVLVSDAFFPFADSVEAIHAAGMVWVVQPGGSRRDAEVVEACDRWNMAMALTGVRHFRH